MSSPPHVVLYSRAGCHLCDDAVDILRRYGLEPQIVDIDSDPALRERFSTTIPVVEIDGQLRFQGVINEVLLVRLLVNR